MPTATLSAAYASPASAPFAHSTTLELAPDAAAGATGAKSAYLSSLRAATAQLQERVNAELTTRMEEDVARQQQQQQQQDGAGKAGAGKPKKDEAAEEENYGEEAQEDDD